RSIEVAFFAQGEARITSFLSDIEAFGNGGFGIERDDFLSWSHYLASKAASQVEGIENDRAPPGRGATLLLRRGQEQAKLLLRMSALGFADRFDASLAHQPLGRVVQHPVKGIGCDKEPAQRLGHPKRDRQRILDRRPFWR